MHHDSSALIAASFGLNSGKNGMLMVSRGIEAGDTEANEFESVV